MDVAEIGHRLRDRVSNFTGNLHRLPTSVATKLWSLFASPRGKDDPLRAVGGCFQMTRGTHTRLVPPGPCVRDRHVPRAQADDTFRRTLLREGSKTHHFISFRSHEARPPREAVRLFGRLHPTDYVRLARLLGFLEAGIARQFLRKLFERHPFARGRCRFCRHGGSPRPIEFLLGFLIGNSLLPLLFQLSLVCRLPSFPQVRRVFRIVHRNRHHGAGSNTACRSGHMSRTLSLQHGSTQRVMTLGASRLK